MDLFNGVLSKLALLAVLFAVVAAVDFPNNPARYLLKSFCHTLYQMSSGHSAQSP
jgi:hypothetical protein